MREVWTDERLDDLSRGMHREFSQVHSELRALRTELHSEVGALRIELHSEVGALRTELRTEIASVRTDLGAEIRSLRTLIIAGGASIVASTIGSVVAVIVAHAL